MFVNMVLDTMILLGLAVFAGIALYFFVKTAFFLAHIVFAIFEKNHQRDL